MPIFNDKEVMDSSSLCRNASGLQRAMTSALQDGTDAASTSAWPSPRQRRLSATTIWLMAGLLTLALLSRFFVIVPVGERGVLMRFGSVQDRVLSEGLHPLWPLAETVEMLSVRLQSLTMNTEGASRDLQDVKAEVAVNWHIDPTKVNRIYQRLGDVTPLADGVIKPAIEDTIKAVVASFTAEELVTKREIVKVSITQLLQQRLLRYDLLLDDVDLLQIDFSEGFREAVEAKQVAEQEAKRAEFEAIRAQRLAEAKVFLAQGESQAQKLLQASLSPLVLQHEAIEKWNGHLPLVVGQETVARVDLPALLKADRTRGRRT